jgi:hypothetical protein
MVNNRIVTAQHYAPLIITHSRLPVRLWVIRVRSGACQVREGVGARTR